MRNKPILISALLFFPSLLSAQINFEALLLKKKVLSYNDTSEMHFVKNDALYTEGWDTLPQPLFWKQIISLSSDTCLINIADGRKPLHKIPSGDWYCQNEAEKTVFKNFVCEAYDIPRETNLYVTAGKKDFYEYKRVLPYIDKSLDVFISNGVDPWYAQSILLIESPGKNHSKSYVGANGPFQLMKSVALRFGLKVNKYTDERTDLRKSALAASKLLKTICIPKVKSMLDERNVAYNETDLWFRLLVLHAYHAGAGNVACVINSLNPASGGIDLFKQIWKTECRGFKNESQNYSQIALANIMTFNDFLNKNGDTVYVGEGNKLFAEYKKKKSSDVTQNLALLQNSVTAYSNDLVDCVIPPAYFSSRMSLVQKELNSLYKKQSSLTIAGELIKKFPLAMSDFESIGRQLLRKRRFEEAEQILKLNILHYPECISAYDSLSKVYALLGKKQLALQYSVKSKQLRKTEN